jgi:DNA-binding IclR family transcriptional regulator
MSEAERSTTNTAIQKAIAILETIANDTRALSLPDIAEQLSLPRQTIHRVIKQLEEIGLVVRDPGRERYRIGQRLNQLALATISNPHQNKTSHAVLQGLVDDVAETCNVGMLDGHEVIYVDRVECDWPLRVQLKAGSRVPVYCTAIGKLLLANQDAEARQHILSVSKLKRYTDNTITTVDELEADLEEIRLLGYSINNQEDSVGLIAMAVPIRDIHGHVVAGLAVHAPEARLSIPAARRLLPKFHEAAGKISIALFS